MLETDAEIFIYGIMNWDLLPNVMDAFLEYNDGHVDVFAPWNTGKGADLDLGRGLLVYPIFFWQWKKNLFLIQEPSFRNIVSEMLIFE